MNKLAFSPSHALNRLFLVVIALFCCFSVYSARAFDLKDTDGRAQKLAELKGKWVVVNFWATWCAPCVKEIPDIAEFATAHLDKVRVLGIAMDWEDTGKRDADQKKLLAFAKKVGHTYPLVLSDANTEKVFGKVKGMPTTIVYDPAGKVAYQKTGTVTKELLTRVVNGEKVL